MGLTTDGTQVVRDDLSYIRQVSIQKLMWFFTHIPDGHLCLGLFFHPHIFNEQISWRGWLGNQYWLLVASVPPIFNCITNINTVSHIRKYLFNYFTYFFISYDDPKKTPGAHPHTTPGNPDIKNQLRFKHTKFFDMCNISYKYFQNKIMHHSGYNKKSPMGTNPQVTNHKTPYYLYHWSGSASHQCINFLQAHAITNGSQINSLTTNIRNWYFDLTPNIGLTLVLFSNMIDIIMLSNVYIAANNTSGVKCIINQLLISFCF